MLIATFGSSTGWAGKTITREGDVFVLEDHGPVSAADVMEYDRQGQLVWANEGTRGWVGAEAQRGNPATLVATFSSTTGWAGKFITHKSGHFRLQDFGEVSASDVAAYAAQGQLDWASEELRVWVQKLAQDERATTVIPAPRKGPSSLNVLGGILLAIGILVFFYFVAVFDTSVSVDAQAIGIDRVNNIGLMNDQQNGIIVGVLLMLAGGAVLVVAAVQRSRNALVPVTPRADERKCPYCAETIKTEAVVCRFCNRDVSRGTAG